MSFFQIAKELARALLARVGLYRILRRLWGVRLDHLKLSALEDRFARIYETRLWTLGDPKTPRSGSGSSMEATAGVRSELPNLLKAVGTRTLLDIGCGDFSWMRTVDLAGVDYIGVDIVQSLIDENNVNYGGDTVRFVQANAVWDPLPDADTVLIREVLFHLSFADALAVLRNTLSRTRKYLLITTEKGGVFNFDIKSGDFRMLNLEAAPFNFPEPEFAILENATVQNRRLAGWKAESIRPSVGASETGATKP